MITRTYKQQIKLLLTTDDISLRQNLDKSKKSIQMENERQINWFFLSFLWTVSDSVFDELLSWFEIFQVLLSFDLFLTQESFDIQMMDWKRCKEKEDLFKIFYR